MTAALVSIGDELLIGQTVNTNAAWLGAELAECGVRVVGVATVGDIEEAIIAEIERATDGADLVIVSGGLGPTHDDRTCDAVCTMLGCDRVVDQEQLARIERRFAERGLEMNERSRRQAIVPSACTVLPNETGSAPGLLFTWNDRPVYVLPGVPFELKSIAEASILPALRSQRGELRMRTWLTLGIIESALADRLEDATIPLLDSVVTLAYLPAAGGIRLRAMCERDDADAVDRYERLCQAIAGLAAPWIVADRDATVAEVLGEELLARGLCLVTAESCTGGMIGAQITSTPGASRWYLGGTVSYANDVKRSLLGVPPETILAHGAVSGETVEAMALGARARLGGDVSVAVSGIAGPGGGTPEKPVGTVWVAVVHGSDVRSERHQLGRDRETVRARAVAVALNLALRMVRGTTASAAPASVPGS